MDSERKKGKASNKAWAIGCGFAVLIAVVLLVIALFGRQETKTGGMESKVIRMESMTCAIDDYLYPFFTYDNSDSKDLKIVAIFSDSGLAKVSLQQMLYYGNTDTTTRSSAVNHAAMNMSFSKYGLGADALGANYAKLSAGLRFGLYEVRENMEREAMQYFLLNDDNDLSYESIKKHYEGMGMKCTGKNA